MLILVAAGFMLTACDRHIFGGLSVIAEEDALVLSGRIDSGATRRFTSALAARPDITTIVVALVPGARDMHVARDLARLSREKGLSTVVPAGGLVAEAGIDLFLGGVNRVIAPDACVGVHSWSGGLFGVEEGRYLPRDDPAHIPHRAFYKQMGVSEDFYWFSLKAASVDGMHWMRGIEINHFGLSHRRISQGESGSEVDHRCAARF